MILTPGLIFIEPRRISQYALNGIVAVHKAGGALEF